jgi:putative heme-binding domain-containing protein
MTKAKAQSSHFDGNSNARASSTASGRLMATGCWLLILSPIFELCPLGFAAESWADKRLTVTNRLEVWLDTSRQPAARQALKLPALRDGSSLDLLLDASGNHLDLAQRTPEARPKFKQAGADALIRFDGKDDSLSASNLRRAFTNCTVFVVTAPKSNAGFFRGLLAFGETGKNDFTSGFNLDLGSGGTPNFSFVNLEGAGFQGQQNLRTTPGAFNRWQVLTVTSQPGTNGTRLFVDGAGQGKRERAVGSVLRADEFTLGARCYSNTPEPPHTQGYLDGDIAEVLVFSRVLPQAERQAVEKYLLEKHAPLQQLAYGNVPGGLRAWETVTNQAPIQMLVPGFAVRELPLELKNINSLKYRADGKLYALGYNGQIWLLSDTDGDGLEDKAGLFWDGSSKLRGPIGMAVTPPGYKHGQGVFVPSKGKLSLIVDKNGDDRADEEIIVATGWKEITQNVDAIGVALDKDGSIYFALGTANYANGFLLDADGKSQFDLKSERGTVLKVAPDFSKREIICTGIRFPVAMTFNRHGDLFCSEQEGATWLPNGNPFDELLHIQPGRHYGFPPRHPKHLPDVFDEPSVFDYAPQHQSTCGISFNEPVNGGKTFGPANWAGDVFVAGESRGKLYRTKLVKTAAGYVAQNNLIACLNLLTVEVCVTPRGDLLVACHSGKPDWGTGPNGVGKIFRIRYSDPNAPQPALAWSASPTEIHIAFDRALDPANLRDLTKRTGITAGKYVMPGDRFETMWPGYQVIHDQRAQPRFDVPVFSINVTADRRNLILTTAPRTAALNYAVLLPNVARNAGLRPGANQSNAQLAGSETGAPPNYDDIELLVDNHGVEAKWTSEDGKETWSGWLPHLDTEVAKVFTVGSAAHERLLALVRTRGKLRITSKLDLFGMTQPSVQPGSRLDYEPDSERIFVGVETFYDGRFECPDFGIAGGTVRGRINWGISGKAGRNWYLCTVGVGTSETSFPLVDPSWRIEPKLDLARPFPLRRFYLPWAEPKAEPTPLATERKIPELAGGNWLRGRRVFFSEQAACAKCHRAGGQGGRLGPDLSNLIHRDYASVLKDIREPSAAINPDHTAFNVELTDGEPLTGVLLTDASSSLTLGDATGKPITVPKSKVKSVKPATLSLMPAGLDQALGETAMKDLLTFLLTSPLEPAPLERDGAPPPRKLVEVEALLASINSKPETLNSKPTLRIVLCDGPKDHGKGEHDYPLWKKRWSTLLALADGVTVDTAHIWPSAEQFAKADVVAFFNNNPGWNDTRARELDAYLARGGGAIYFHWAVEAQTNAVEFAKRIGLASNSKALKYRHGPIDFVFAGHPLARGFTTTSFTKQNFVDETYWNFVGNPGDVALVASSVEDGEPRPQMWTRQIGKGRVFVAVPGHYNWTFDDPVFRVLALRGLCWAASQPMDRLAELATIGARLEESR